MDEKVSIFGAAVFWLYILAALVCTAATIRTIVHLPRRGSPSVKVFTLLAMLSFAALSVNMLDVLVLSYRLWTERQSAASRAWLDRSFHVNVWTWSTNSTPFHDFGRAIVGNAIGYLWTQSALLATFSVGLFMSAEGKKHNVPHLWTFFALSQILPISFAQNLFYIAILRTEPRAPTPVFRRTVILSTTAAYCACLAIAPYAARSQYLIPMILLTRAILALPLALARRGPAVASQAFCDHISAQKVLTVLAVVLTLKQIYPLSRSAVKFSDVVHVLLGHPAVTTLGLDFLLSLTSFVVWSNRRELATEAEKSKNA